MPTGIIERNDKMKKLMMALVLMPMMALAGGEEVVLDFRTMEVDGIEWTYFVHDGLAEDGRADIKNEASCISVGV